MLTHRVREADMNRALTRIQALEAVQGEAVRIRMEMLAG
jgi:homoserine dehydrogenase